MLPISVIRTLATRQACSLPLRPAVIAASRALHTIGSSSRSFRTCVRPFVSVSRVDASGVTFGGEGSLGAQAPQSNTGQISSKPGSGKQTPIDVLIKEDHDTVRELYKEYLGASDQALKERKVYTIIREMVMHSGAEEVTLYPFLHKDPRFTESPEREKNGEVLVERSLGEHQEMTDDLRVLDAMKVGDPEFDQVLSRIMKEFEEHGQFEEKSVLPLLKEKCTQAELIMLGEKFESATANVVTTRPHPMAPREGAAAMAAHMASKPIDKVRDIASGREEAIRQEPRAHHY